MIDVPIHIGNKIYMISPDYTIYIMKKNGTKQKIKCDSEKQAYKMILANYVDGLIPIEYIEN